MADVGLPAHACSVPLEMTDAPPSTGSALPGPLTSAPMAPAYSEPAPPAAADSRARGVVAHSTGSALVGQAPDHAGLTRIGQHEQQHDTAEDSIPREDGDMPDLVAAEIRWVRIGFPLGKDQRADAV